MKTLSEIFKHTLKDIYYAETALTKALPKMASAAGNADLKAAFAHHLDETRGQIKMLDRCLRRLVKSQRVKNVTRLKG